MSLSDLLSNIDGSLRQQVASSLWAAWRDEGREAAILTGFSGLGKTEQVVRPLVNEAVQEGHLAILVEIPLHPTDLEQEVLGELVQSLRACDADVLAKQVESQPALVTALRLLLKNGALVVLDEFQRLLDLRGQPADDALGKNLQQLARRAPDDGCLWLVTNRLIDPTWTEPFYETQLEAPAEPGEQERIVLKAVSRADAEDRFPADRRLEIVRRLGGNPRALRLLGILLRIYPIDELLGPPRDVPAEPADPRLTESLERTLLAKAEEGVTDNARRLLRNMSILRGPAKWELVEAVGEPLGNVRENVRALRERFLLDVRAGRYHVHPVVREVEGPRLRKNAEAWRDAHRTAGSWYARPLHRLDRRPLGDADVALRLAAARYHLLEARADDELNQAMQGVSRYIERAYGWSARSVASAQERDAQISLLSAYLEQPGANGVEFTYAKLLLRRGAPGDAETALPHAERATEDEDFAHPWVLWIKLVREVEGEEAAINAAKKAAEQVAPEKGRFSVYQLLGACLNRLGRTGEAVAALLEGAERSVGSEARLVEQACLLAAPDSNVALLREVHEWATAQGGFAHQVALADVLLLERQGNWQQAAESARHARDIHPRYIHLALHETLCWLGAGAPERAQEALDRFLPWRHFARSGATWLASLVALHRGQVAQAAGFLKTYLGADSATSEGGIRAVLLREWDHRVATVGESNPALVAPILPASVVGLQHDVQRPQYGPPVLPQHGRASHRALEADASAVRILAVGTEWQSGQGGLSTLNRQLCLALAAAGASVACIVVRFSEKDRSEAAAQGVTLVEATPTPGRPDHEALSRKPDLPDGFEPHFIIGHGRVTGPAAKVLADDHFPAAKRLHFVHMAPDEIEWYKLDREDDSGARAEERTQIELDLGRTAARVVAVGPRLHNRYLRDLSPYEVPAPIRIDPGFDAPEEQVRTPPPGEPWSILVLGRLEDDHLKGLDIAARAIGLAAERRDANASPLELLVRGALPGTSPELQKQLRDWSGLSRVVVRPYTSDGETLDADLKRVSLLTMPSRSEGFGLVGLEAIVAGTPALVSAESGLAGVLREVLELDQVNRLVVAVSSSIDRTAEDWSRAIEGVLRDREAAFRRAAEVRTLLGKQKTWAAAVAGLMIELESLRVP